ncbi:sugar ABC transporter substrate-binding protein [Chengkuizengella sp. 2205SS18-9]|uniref:Sugar ABC transporter substrate-binding protein n=1 Tax=Chengkuizengella axinellae TaxID=3064388 RepID=A0ABT9IZJ6_9BACL|nr:sugar ABC transporter substrate-binding protein [Chengkuizengella sp. 2205SS18-9]MDP5274791.1 sugar ABC transporter substrate-binding protein [Chengkuizengella sp. 2205SS18-9]
MKKIIVVMSAIILLLGLVAGCGAENESGGASENNTTTGSESGSEGTTSDSESQKPEEVTIRAAVFPGDEETFKIAYEDFKKQYPHINVEIDSFPIDKYYEKLRLELGGGSGYDVFAGQIDSMVDSDMLLPLDDLINENNTDVSGYGTLYDSMRVNGDVVGLPYRKSNWMMFYNKDLFDAKGVDYPSDDMTWDDFRELAKQMTSGEGVDKIYGAYFPHWAQAWYLPAVQTGATIIDKDLTPFKDALQYRMDLESDGSIMSWTESKSTKTSGGSYFQKGTLAMNIYGDWLVASLRKAEEEGKLSFDWDVAPIPHPEDVAKNTSLALPVTLMINKETEQQQAAFEFVQFMTGEQGAEHFASSGILTGYMSDKVKEAYIGDGSQKPENIQYFLETKEYSEYPMLPGVRNVIIKTIFVPEGELALIGQQTIDETIEIITERVQDEWADEFEGLYKLGN